MNTSDLPRGWGWVGWGCAPAQSLLVLRPRQCAQFLPGSWRARLRWRHENASRRLESEHFNAAGRRRSVVGFGPHRTSPALPPARLVKLGEILAQKLHQNRQAQTTSRAHSLLMLWKHPYDPLRVPPQPHPVNSFRNPSLLHTPVIVTPTLHSKTSVFIQQAQAWTCPRRHRCSMQILLP